MRLVYTAHDSSFAGGLQLNAAAMVGSHSSAIDELVVKDRTGWLCSIPIGLTNVKKGWEISLVIMASEEGGFMPSRLT